MLRKAMPTALLTDGPKRARDRIVLAHGAGAPMRSPFMQSIAEALAQRGFGVVRFEFPYMAAGQRRPDPPRVLRACWLDVIEQLGGASKLVIGGKSMGGRIASMLADEVGARGLVCLGYPFHPAGRPEKTRVEHLADMRTPALIVQGTRDALGNREDVEGYALSRCIAVEWIEDGDHSLKPRKRSGRTLEQAMDEAVEAIAKFVAAH
jgi:predicted alpha/beta-hydrolase family hydrolase